ncbi:MAG: glycosyltransferase family 4 protein [Acidimicrobiales bacterium]
MIGLDIVQVNADRGIAPGATKGAALHLRGVAAGLAACGHSLQTYSARLAEGPFPVPVKPLHELETVTEAAVVYERYSLGHLGGLELARSLDVPFVLEVNAPLVDEAIAHRPGTLPPNAADVEEKLLAEADLVITVSTALSEWVSTKRDGLIETIANGFEPSWFPPPNRAAAEAGGADQHIVFLGHPKPWHGAELLVDLLIDMAELGYRPQLLVVGGGPGADTLVARATELGVGQQIVVTGPTEPHRVAVHLATAAIGLAPYPRQDPFYFCPLKIVDYLAAGLPIVATRQGDIAELVQDAGLLVEPDDRAALATAVAELLGDRQRARTMGISGRRRALTEMTWRRVAEMTEQAILQLRHESLQAASGR